MSREQPTILQLIPELETGGAELSTLEIASALRSAGGRALVASEGGRLVPRLTESGAEFIPFPASSKNPARIIWNARTLRQLIITEGVDIVHARSRAPAWSGYLAAKKTGAAFLTTFHGAYSERNALKKAYNQVMAAGPITIANSRYTADLIKKRYGISDDRIRVIYRGIDGAVFDPTLDMQARQAKLRDRWGVDQETPIILMLARISPIKGHHVVIDAMVRLIKNNQFKKARVVFAGDAQGRADYLQSLQTQIGKAGLTDVISFVGHVEDVPAALSLAQCSLIATTKPETFGRTSVEAQAMGCPVIATNIGAPPETVLAAPETERVGITGWLVPPNDPDQLARCLNEVLSLTKADRDAMGQRARAHATSNFSLDKMRVGTLAVYDELIGSNLAENYSA